MCHGGRETKLINSARIFFMVSQRDAYRLQAWPKCENQNLTWTSKCFEWNNKLSMAAKWEIESGISDKVWVVGPNINDWKSVTLMI